MGKNIILEPAVLWQSAGDKSDHTGIISGPEDLWRPDGNNLPTAEEMRGSILIQTEEWQRRIFP